MLVRLWQSQRVGSGGVETFLFCVAEVKWEAVLAGPHCVIAVDNCLQAVPVYVKSKTSSGSSFPDQ